MFGKKPKEEDLKLSVVENTLLDDMVTYGPDSPEYPTLLHYLERVRELRKKDDRKRVSYDTVVQVMGTLGGILIIVIYEQKHVLTTKALTFLPKGK